MNATGRQNRSGKQEERGDSVKNHGFSLDVENDTGRRVMGEPRMGTLKRSVHRTDESAKLPHSLVSGELVAATGNQYSRQRVAGTTNPQGKQ